MRDQDIVDGFEEFVRKKYLSNLAKAIKKGERSIQIDYANLEKFNPKIADELIDNPDKCIELFINTLSSMDLAFEKDEEIIPRFLNIPEERKISIRNIRSKDIGKLVAIEGLVRQASDVRPVSSIITFECPSCGTLIREVQRGKKESEPNRCPNCGRKGKFTHKSKVLVDTQRLVLEESPEMLEGGDQPKRISIFLNEDLVDPEIVKKTCPGSKVRITGIVKEVPVELRTGVKTVRFDLMIIANNMESIEMEFEELEITDEDIKKIKELAADKNIYKMMIDSIAPTLWGYESIKEAIALQLFSGVLKKRTDGTKMRGDIHILLVGDPGVGKSQMLKYISTLAPKARYVVGTSASGAGLTATVVRDEFLRGWSLEAGALVLANGGIACIDEIDKMGKEDRVAIHEAMEQQTISVSKANIQATLRAETTMLAAANPKLGRFDPYGSIAEQIDLPPTLINRFDLIFTIRDKPSKDRDIELAKHILETAKKPDSKTGVIKSDMLKKYVAHASRIHPELTTEATDEIMEFYVRIRNKDASSDEGMRPIPISPRQLEALIRLSEASAKVRLSKKVLKQDAQRAIALLSSCLREVGIDPETGELDIDRIVTGITSSQRNRIVQIREIIREIESRTGPNIPIDDILTEADSKGIERSKTEEIIDRMKRDGEIFEPKRDVLRRMPR